MDSFEWMELDTLTRQIEHAQSRIDAARATKNFGLVTGASARNRANGRASCAGAGRFDKGAR